MGQSVRARSPSCGRPRSARPPSSARARLAPAAARWPVLSCPAPYRRRGRLPSRGERAARARRILPADNRATRLASGRKRPADARRLLECSATRSRQRGSASTLPASSSSQSTAMAAWGCTRRLFPLSSDMASRCCSCRLRSAVSARKRPSLEGHEAAAAPYPVAPAGFLHVEDEDLHRAVIRPLISNQSRCAR